MPKCVQRCIKHCILYVAQFHHLVCPSKKGFTFCWFEATLHTVLKKVEKVQRRATRYLIGGHLSGYRERLERLELLPLMYWMEIQDLMFQSPSDNFNILEGSRRSASSHHLGHKFSRTSYLSGHICSKSCGANFNSSLTCTYHFLCPCPNCLFILPATPFIGCELSTFFIATYVFALIVLFKVVKHPQGSIPIQKIAIWCGLRPGFNLSNKSWSNGSRHREQSKRAFGYLGMGVGNTPTTWVTGVKKDKCRFMGV